MEVAHSFHWEGIDFFPLCIIIQRHILDACTSTTSLSLQLMSYLLDITILLSIGSQMRSGTLLHWKSTACLMNRTDVPIKLDFPLACAFRLPYGGNRLTVQFATGLLIKNKDLYISYGVSDCFAALARVENIGARLPRWEERGIGSQT